MGVSFSVATSESWKDRNSGERKEKTEWHNVSIFSEGLARVAKNYLRKGSKVYLEGQIPAQRRRTPGHGRDESGICAVPPHHTSCFIDCSPISEARSLR